ASTKKARRQFNVDFFNITTWGPQAQDYLEETSSTKDRDIIGIAEHHLRQPVLISKDRPAGFEGNYFNEEGSDITVVIAHMIEHPTEQERWTGPTRWVIGNEMADKYASWGAEHGALGPAILAQQQVRDQITAAVQNRLLGISMAVTVEGRESSHLDQHGNARLDFKTVQIGTRVVHDTHKTQLTQGWLWCEKCGATSYLGNHKSRIVAGVARKLAKPCVPPTTAGRRVIMDLQKGRLPRRAKHDEDQAAAAPPEEVTIAGFNPRVSSAEVIDLDGESSEAETPQQAQPQPPRHPHPAAEASWQLVDHMEGYAEQWMDMVDPDVWEDKDDWMEHSVPYLVAVTIGSRTDAQDQKKAATPREIQQTSEFCEDIWKGTHKARRRLMTYMLTLPRGTRQQAARAHMGAFQGRRTIILTHSMPSSDRRPLPSTADGYRAWTPEHLDDDSTQPDSEVPELEGHDSDHGMGIVEALDQHNDATTSAKASTTMQGAPWIAKPTGPDLMKYAREAKEAGTQHPRLCQQRGDEEDPGRELAWLERNRLEQLMQTLAGGWAQLAGESGWQTWSAARVPHVPRELQTSPYQRLFSEIPGPSSQNSQRRAAEDICRMAWPNSGMERAGIQRQDPREAARRRTMAEQLL
ncbi:unnamed protein product, partial [Prorocentrum cordatum]